MMFDIVLTGSGALSPFGGRDAFFRALGVGSETQRAVVNEARPGAGLTDVLGLANAKLRIARYLDPVSKNAIAALEEAMTDAGITAGEVARDPYGYAIVLAATRGPGETRDKAYEQLRAREGKLLSSTLFSNMGYNIAAAMAAIAHGIKGPNLTLAGRSNISLHLFRRARQLLNTGRVHTVFVGFSESRVQVASLWQWACMFCLERPERARQRGADGGLALAEIEPAFREQHPALLDRMAIRLPRPIPEPLLPEVLAASDTVKLDHGGSLGIGPEYLPLLHAGRLKTIGLSTENGHVAFPVRTRSGLSLLAVDHA
jgi:3-oxoacyl-(acyl-carrier-protein) synthase